MTEQPSTAAEAPPARAGGLPAGIVLPREFLAFKLGAEEYGIDILRVQEIRSYEEPTRLAGAPPFIKGVINLRGVIVPVLDLRLKFDLPEARCDELTVVVVLNLGERVVGIVVDAVSDVITPTAEQLRPVPEFNPQVDTEHLLAIGAIGDRMLILVDILQLMSAPDMGLATATLQ
jgi:purine-binding chemotaxis protein CheW